MEGSDGVFVSMPNYKVSRDGNDEFRDVCNPVTKDFYEQFTNKVLESYEAAKSGENTRTFEVSSNLPRYNISVHKMKDSDSNVLAYADLSIGGSFVVKGIKIMDGSNGAFVSMPNYKTNKLDETVVLYTRMFAFLSLKKQERKSLVILFPLMMVQRNLRLRM